MTDRELLEAAAKAVDFVGFGYCELSGGAPVLYVPGLGVWDPLADDGDALRLAVNLGMNVLGDAYGDTGVGVQAGELRDINVYESSRSDPYAATRRAIVRAAAALAPQADAPPQAQGQQAHGEA